jgi:hypothetical protein
MSLKTFNNKTLMASDLIENTGLLAAWQPVTLPKVTEGEREKENQIAKTKSVHLW